MRIRFLTLKNNYVESRGSDLLKYLLERCRETEKSILEKSFENSGRETGRLPFRAMTNLLQSSQRLCLSRLQVRSSFIPEFDFVGDDFVGAYLGHGYHGRGQCHGRHD